jgi:curved DNA-binding protein CbpA
MKQLGLEPGFTHEQLRRAYLRGSRKLSPDKGGDADKFIAMQKAHAFLLRLAAREEVDLDAPLPERTDPVPVRPDSKPRFKSANDAYLAENGDRIPMVRRGHGDYLKRDVNPDLRPPDRINAKRLNTEFERIAQARGATPLTVSTHVVAPVYASGSVGHPIIDDADDFTEQGLADLQAAYGVT